MVGKRILLLFIFFCCASVYAQPPGQWMWIHGDSTINSAGNFGMQGVPSPTNEPPALYEPCEWTDLNGNFWMFGGSSIWGTFSALWKYTPLNNQWTWMNGPDTVSAPGMYGVQGVPSPSNYPPSRSWGVTSWVDLQGNLWMFGGCSAARNSDLWKYDVSINQWTWMKGPNAPNQPGVYGTQGVPSISNNPPPRCECSVGWTDNSGDLWMFGGQMAPGNYYYNDLWRFNIATNTWTWMKGSNLTNQPGVYGTLGIEAPNNTPDSRMAYSHWKDNVGRLWLLGGYDRYGSLNDLWRFNISTDMWAWINGSNTANNTGLYETLCLTDTFNEPQARFESRACWIDHNKNFWLFGGGHGGLYKNDLWMYCVGTNKWTWVAGDSTYNPVGYWGAINVANLLNRPSGRVGSVGWSDNNGHLYLFGGMDISNNKYNDLWVYTINPECAPCDSISMSITEDVRPLMKIYPNPSHYQFTISIGERQNGELKIFDITGREIYKEEINSKLSTFNCQLNPGVYFVKVSGGEGEAVQKLIIE